jgi:hypothetical protein
MDENYIYNCYQGSVGAETLLESQANCIRDLVSTGIQTLRCWRSTNRYQHTNLATCFSEKWEVAGESGKYRTPAMQFTASRPRHEQT